MSSSSQTIPSAGPADAAPQLSTSLEKHWSIAPALAQLDLCEFECEGGPLSNNVAYQWLKAAAKVGPEFMPGQGVFYLVEAEIAGVKMSRWAHFYIIGCFMRSSDTARYWTYTLSNDPPGPWHYGETSFNGVPGKLLRLDNPDSDGALGRQDGQLRDANK